MPDPVRLSYTELRDYKRCPYYVQLLRTPVESLAQFAQDSERAKRTLVGDVLQKLVERFYVQEFWRCPPLTEKLMYDHAETLLAKLSHDGQVLFSGDELPQARTAIQDAILPILTVIKEERLLAPKTHAELELQKTYVGLWPDGRDVVVHGRADFVYDRPEELTLTDGKAGRTVGAHLDQDQLRFYAMLLRDDPRFGRLPNRVGFWYFRHGIVLWKTFTKKQLATFERELMARIQRLGFDDYTPRTGSHCRSCDLRLRCEPGKLYGVTKKPTKGRPALDLPGNFGRISF